MTISQTPFLADIASAHSGPPIPAPKRAYFQQRLRNRVFNFLLEKFVSAQQDGLTKANLARRIGKTPDLINRWLGAPSNLTLDSISDILLGICAEELELGSSSPVAKVQQNYSDYEHLNSKDWMQKERIKPNFPRSHSPQRHSPLTPLGHREPERVSDLGLRIGAR